MSRFAFWQNSMIMAGCFVIAATLTGGCGTYGTKSYDHNRMQTHGGNQTGNVLHRPAPPGVDRDDLMGRNQNPNLVIGHSNVQNNHLDMSNMEMMAKSVPGVENARITMHGGNAYVTLDLKHNVTAKEARNVEKKVIAALKKKVPRYDFHVTSNEGYHK